MSEHTELPWKAVGATVWMGDTLYMVADCREHTPLNGEDDANAQFIVKACNNYEEMLKALKSLISDWERTPHNHLHKREQNELKRVQTLIAKATED